jgi:hypothetical protein
MNYSSKKVAVLKYLLLTQTIVLVVYTTYAINREGWTLFQSIIDNIKAFGWNGQFNLDFSCYLILSGLWIMWRQKFSFSSIAFAVVVMIIGIIAFAPYLLYLLMKENGDLKKVLVGER